MLNTFNRFSQKLQFFFWIVIVFSLWAELIQVIKNVNWILFSSFVLFNSVQFCSYLCTLSYPKAKQKLIHIKCLYEYLWSFNTTTVNRYKIYTLSLVLFSNRCSRIKGSTQSLELSYLKNRIINILRLISIIIEYSWNSKFQYLIKFPANYRWQRWIFKINLKSTWDKYRFSLKHRFFDKNIIFSIF